MSGQPNKTENDIIRHKNEYIERLNLETSINKMNYDANKLYKETGQVMPIIGLTDNRSIEDKLLDTEKLKQDIAKTIGTISSLTFGTNVVQAIQENPLNIDNKLLIFTAQRINEIVLNLKKIYAVGIRGDKNDVQQLVNFITKMFSDANAFTQTAKTFVNTQPSGALNPTGSPNIGAMQNVKQALSGILPPFGNYLDRFKVYYQQLPPNITNANLERTIMRRYEEVFQIINYLIATCITPQQYNHILDIAKEYVFANGPIDIARVIVQKLSEIFPQPNLVTTFFNKNKNYFEISQNFEKFRNDYMTNGVNGPFFESYRTSYLTSLDKLNEVLLNFLGLLNPAGYTLDQFDQEYLFLQDFFRLYGDGSGGGPPPPAGGPAPVPAGGAPIAPVGGAPIAPVGGAPVGGAPVGGAPVGAVAGAPIAVAGPAGQIANQQQWDNYVIQHVIGLTDVQLNALYFAIPNTAYLLHIGPLIGRFGNANASRNEKEQACIQALRLQYNNPNYGPQAGIGNIVQGAVGLGITKRRRGRPKGNGFLKPYSLTVKENLDLTRGIEPTGKFIKFGKYLLNSHKLNKENIFSLKHISGGNIIDIPSTRLTEGLGKVIKTIIGGGNPHYNDLNGLSETEQNYLHKVCSKSNIIDKISIPTPSKDAEEKEIHKFEVMKGEIASGNDSPELIKDFKRMIMKLQKNNSLPKKEVYEILEELNSLGY